ncbi:hypothetical protein ACFE04_029610 [Oxalis oulophora]
MGLSQPAALKLCLSLLALSMAGYIVGPPLYFHIRDGLASAFTHSSSSSSSLSITCSVCSCDCSTKPILTIPQALSNASVADCAKHDPELGEDTENNFAELLSEELKLREAEALENQRRADMALLEAKKVASQYQKEADKCSSGMETCEEAREKSEAVLAAQKRLTAMWEQRARLKGWKEGLTKSNGQSHVKVQTS